MITLLVVDCEAIFGKRKGSNGFKLDICCDPDVVARIQELYGVVIKRRKSLMAQSG
jgi:hypothetical protein